MLVPVADERCYGFTGQIRGARTRRKRVWVTRRENERYWICLLMVIAASERREKEDVWRAGEESSRRLNGLHIRFCCEALARSLRILGDSRSMNKWDRNQKVELPSIRSYLFQLELIQKGLALLYLSEFAGQYSFYQTSSPIRGIGDGTCFYILEDFPRSRTIVSSQYSQQLALSLAVLRNRVQVFPFFKQKVRMYFCCKRMACRARPCSRSRIEESTSRRISVDAGLELREGFTENQAFRFIG